MSKNETTYGEAASFISKNMKLVSGADQSSRRFQVNQEHYNNFLGERGITPETIKQVSEAVIDWNNGTARVLADELVANPEVSDVAIHTRTPNGVVRGSMNREVQFKQPKSDEVQTSYGVFKISIKLKSRVDAQLLKDCSAEIKAASSK